MGYGNDVLSIMFWNSPFMVFGHNNQEFLNYTEALHLSTSEKGRNLSKYDNILIYMCFGRCKL